MCEVKNYQLKCNIKSLIAESRILKTEIKKNILKKNDDIVYSLTLHRDIRLKMAQRVSYLAYACVRDVPYSKLESKTSLNGWEKSILLKEVRKKARKFSNTPYHEKIDNWLNSACEHLNIPIDSIS